ncbi:hypothetical protein C8R46DRAFT_900610 [Mycena filopes]|nr:hypothetical protein C8R46DRAFT_900610 [Mycena filopes]
MVPSFPKFTASSSSHVPRIIRNERWIRSRQHPCWQHGLVALADADIAFPNSILTDSARIITRLDSLPGFNVLDQHREEQLRIQPSTDAYKKTFEIMSHGLLQNIDWQNIMVAGGIVLGTLITVGHSARATRWISSDIDLYIYGLSPTDANRRIHHIFDVVRSNLPQHMRTLVVRNSKTVTIYAEYPLRRIQIVLKLAKTPRDVLLNFDLDICAMGWDGNEVWMLPRAARAIESGFGLRLLPGYMTHLDNSNDGQSSVNVSFLAEEARSWTHQRRALVTELGFNSFVRSDLNTPISERSGPLSNFTSFMRHVAFWEMGQNTSDVVIEQDNWASTSYEDACSLIIFYSTKRYSWDAGFHPAKFASHILQSNIHDIDKWLTNDLNGRLQRLGLVCGDELESARRMVSASNVKDLLLPRNDIRMPIVLPVDFAVYANNLVREAVVEAGLKETRILEPVGHGYDIALERRSTTPNEGLFLWTIEPHLMWQHTDRRIDEVFEVLFAFRRANKRLEENDQLKRFTAELSRRQSRGVDECPAFRRWVSEIPV